MINLKKSTFLYIFFAMMACSVPVKAQNPATQTITLSDGGRYTGQVLHGKPNGKGKAVYKNGDVYEGEFLKGKRHGQGTYTFTDGEKYTGEWFQDHQHGMGDYYFMNGNRYSGLWYKDYQSGQGTMFYYNGDKSISMASSTRDSFSRASATARAS